MANFGVNSTGLGANLTEILLAGDIQPGSDVSYQICKSLYLYHPLGLKMAESPVRLAQSQERVITVAKAPEERVVEAFNAEWEQLEASELILNLKSQARVYGIATIAMISEGTPADRPIKPEALWQAKLSFNVLDPLNTSGSLTFSQDPNSPLFQKHGDITVNGTAYHRSRTITAMNENPIYIAWTSSAFGFVGRSVYQRALYPLKSFLSTMIADDMVARKVGLLIAKMETPGSIVDRITNAIFGSRRGMVQQGETNNVLSIGLKEVIESLNLQNLDGPLTVARNDIIKNIATAADMPAKLLTQEAYVEGFGEGSEDAKAVAQWIDRLRLEMNPEYAWFDNLCMYRAWNPEFYQTIQKEFPEEYGKVPYRQAFYDWKNSFKAEWPSLIREEPSKEVEVDKVKMEALISICQVIMPELDPANKALLIQYMQDNVNNLDKLFEGVRLELDVEGLMASFEEAKDKEDEAAEAATEQQQAAAENVATPRKPPLSLNDSVDRLRAVV